MQKRRREQFERFTEALNRGDLELAVGMLPPDVEWEWPRGMIDSQVFRGREEVLRGARLFGESWAEVTYETEEFLERGDEALALVRYRATGRGSGVELNQVVAWLMEFEGEQPRRLRIFADADKARRRFTAV
jgi:ketosteroid isomerase-like protein